MIYQRELEELYIENQSVWEEVFEGDLEPEDALSYMRVDEDDDLWTWAFEALTDGTPPI